MFDYSWLRVIKWDGSFGPDKVLVTAECKRCGKQWSSLARDDVHAVANLKDMFKRHKLPGSSEPCLAGVAMRSYEYNRYRLKQK